LLLNVEKNGLRLGSCRGWSLL